MQTLAFTQRMTIMMKRRGVLPLLVLMISLLIGAILVNTLMLLRSNDGGGRFNWLQHLPFNQALALSDSSSTDPHWQRLQLANGADSRQVETRLLDVYRLIVAGDTSQALKMAQGLVNEYPNFQLAHLVLADLLLTQAQGIESFGSADSLQFADPTAATARLQSLQAESQKRLSAFIEPPPPGMLPIAFVQLASSAKHAIAVDTSLSRLYLFEQVDGGFRLLDDFYVTVGKDGVSKSKEGDRRTPLGAYYLDARFDKKKLSDLYGSGALHINYPNAFDQSLGRTGGGIWLHGTPSDQFARAPLASDGCIVLANPDIERILNIVDLNTTPVIVSEHLEWGNSVQIEAKRHPFLQALTKWAQGLSDGDFSASAQLYDKNHSGFEWEKNLLSHINAAQGRNLQLKNLSILLDDDKQAYAVISFQIHGLRDTAGSDSLRQYWVKDGEAWRILSESEIPS